MIRPDCAALPIAHRIVLCCGALLLFAGSALYGASADYSHHYYFKERRALTLDTTRLAILDPNPDSLSADRIDDLLENAGFENPSVVPHPFPGWSLFQVSEASGAPRLANPIPPSADPIAAAIALLGSFDSEERYFFAPVFSGDLGPILPTPDILVKFSESLDATTVSTVLQELGMGRMHRQPFGGMKNAYRISTNEHSGIAVMQLASQLAQRPEVVAAEPNMVFPGRGGYVPSDPDFIDSWGLHNIGQFGYTPDVDVDGPEAWDRTLGDPSIGTVIIDTGVQQDHPDLHQLAGHDFTSDGGNGGPVNSCDIHGTAVAGISGSTVDNGLGSAGAAPLAWVISARTFQSIVSSQCDLSWTADYAWTVDALDWALSIGARVTNNSNRYGVESSIVALKYQQTRDLGMIHFASGGNIDPNHPLDHAIWFPAKLLSVNAITAINHDGQRASFSDWGPEAAFTGPGVDLFTTDRTGAAGFTSGDYVFRISGTSFSSPTIAGVAALLLSEASSLDADEVETLLRGSAVDLGAPGWDQYYGWGLPKAGAALQALDLFSDTFESGDLSQWSNTTP